MCLCMIETSSGLLRQSSEIFRKCSETIVWPSDNFWRIFGNLRKICKKSSLVCLYNKQNNTLIWNFSSLFKVLNTQREIPYLRAPMYYLRYINMLMRTSFKIYRPLQSHHFPKKKITEDFLGRSGDFWMIH